MESQSVIPFSITLTPTKAEFAKFHHYVEQIEKEYGGRYGIVKVVPPKGWKPNESIDYQRLTDDIVIPGPIEQNAYGKGGIYELLLIQRKALSIKEYRRKVQIFEDITKDKSAEDVEDLFWKNIAFSPPLYGADFQGSFMDKGIPWNLSELDDILKAGLQAPIPGVTYPYLYVGSWKSMFGWHKEDLDLNSINYNHFGKPKFWYGIIPSNGVKLEKFARSQYNDYFTKCSEYLRHKTIMLSPYLLKQRDPNIQIHKIQQNPGEFVITLSGAYHAGFNWGFNIAEAVNFATSQWLKVFLQAHCCRCTNDSVKIEKKSFLKNLKSSKFKHLEEIKDFEKALLRLAEQKQSSIKMLKTPSNDDDQNQQIKLKIKLHQQKKKPLKKQSDKLVKTQKQNYEKISLIIMNRTSILLRIQHLLNLKIFQESIVIEQIISLKLFDFIQFNQTQSQYLKFFEVTPQNIIINLKSRFKEDRSILQIKIIHNFWLVIFQELIDSLFINKQ